MKELYANVSDSIKTLTHYWVELALQQKNPMDGAKMISNLVDACSTEEEKEFVDFYFNLKLEQLLNESNND